MKSALSLCALLASLSFPVQALDNLSQMDGDDAYNKALQSYSCVDYEKAIRLFRENAEKGHGLSQYMVGIMTEQGQGTLPDEKQAFDWYMRAAKQGLADAYYALGDMYSKGISVEKDITQAYAWFDLAKQGGHKLAGDMLISLNGNLAADQLDKARGFAKDWLAKMVR